MNDFTRFLRDIPDFGDDDKPFVRRLIKAEDAEPIKTNAPMSVFHLASHPLLKTKRRKPPQPLNLRDPDQMLLPEPIVKEASLDAFVQAGGHLVESR